VKNLNEVEITITGKDLSGPAFASAEKHLIAVRALAQNLKQELQGVVVDPLDPGEMERSLIALKSKMQALRIADIADINVNPGLIMVQLNLLKRLIGQAGISDILDINVNQANLTRALTNIASVSESIPVSFKPDTASIDAALAATRAETIPVNYAIGKSPDIPAITGGGEMGVPAATLASWAALNDDTYKVQAGLGDLRPLIASVGDAWATAGAKAQMFGDAVAGKINTGLLATTAFLGRSRDYVTTFGSSLVNGLDLASAATDKNTATMIRAAPFMGIWGGGWNNIRNKVLLFGGALQGLGIPLTASVSLWHIAFDAMIEFAAVIIPATVAFGAFGAMAAPTAQHIAVQLQNIWTAANALQTSIYPLTKSMQNLDATVQPKVYMLYGEALYIATQNTGAFTKIATQAGSVLDWLGARAAVALTSGGMGAFLREGPHDLATIGDIIANIFGTVGNLMRVLPGYAQVLFAGIDDITKAIEALTGSKLGQWATEAFLYFHGFVLWAGLATTGAILLGNALLSLGTKFGLVAAGSTVFDAAQFAGGLQTMIGGTLLFGKELVTLGSAEDLAAAGALSLEGAWAALTAISPWVWAALAVAAIGVFVDHLVTAKTAAQSYADSIQKSLGQSAVSSLPVAILSQQQIAMSTLATAQQELTTSQGKLATATAQSTAQFADQGFGLSGVKKATTQTQGSVDSLTQSVRSQAQTVADQKALLPVLSGDLLRYNEVLKAAGGSTQVLSDAGITSNQILTATGEQLKQLRVIAAATAAQEESFANSTGRVGAVMNALNYSGDTTRNMLGSLDVDMQKVTQGQDAMTGVIWGSEQAFYQYLTLLRQYQGQAKTTGASVGGLNTQSLALSSTFYGQLLPAAQKTIDALEMQLVSTNDLRMVVATQSAEMLQYAGTNAAARASIVAMINDALGPGTVSLQTLDKWVKNNQTSMDGFDAIVGKATIHAGALANVLASDLNVQFEQSLLKSSGADKAITDMAFAITHGGEQTQAFKSARAQLIQDLINTGMSAHDAIAYVDGLQRKIDALHGKSVPVGVTAAASGMISIVGAGWAAGQGNVRFHAAQGGIVPLDAGIPGQDSVLVLTKPGEIFVPPEKGPMLAPALKKAGIPGFGSGGVVGPFGGVESMLSGLPGAADKSGAGDAAKAVSTWVSLTMAAIKKEVTAASLSGASGIVGYAMSLLGKIPYVWGGESLSGADCSGFTSMVYHHAGIGDIPRTSEGQGAWVKRGAPTPGGLAFYHSPAGGPDPGHVAIVANGSTVISQGGGMGPTLMGLHGMPLLWTGTPPNGFGSLGSLGGAGNLSSNASIASEQRYAASLFSSHGWNQGLLPALIALWNAESGWSPWAVNQSSGAYGIPQALPSVWGHPYALGDPGPQIVWGENYIAGRWGNPAAAWGNEASQHWYGRGLDAVISSPTIIGVGEHGSEHVSVTPIGKGRAPNQICVSLEIGSTGNTDFDSFMLKWIKNNVRVKGGGNVQTAFGIH
jgi:cell wall-associated NlpC family hydrolase